MPYFLNTSEDQRAMLEAIGAASLEELFAMVPAELRLGRPLNVPPAMGELELTAHMTALAGRNTSGRQAAACFLGGGSYDHFIPAVVDFVASRSEFYTSYTPYQAEVSQGNLQALFEYQTLVTQLTGMDVSNSSLYDGGSAAAEAVLMADARHAAAAAACVVADSVHPEYRQILATYLANLGRRAGHASPRRTAASRPAAWKRRSTTGPPACCCSIPTSSAAWKTWTRWPRSPIAAGALLVAASIRSASGCSKRPGDYGADIAVAEGQSLGNPMAFGGPYLGIMACREQFVRRMPGRLVGQTVDRRGKRCWVLTLQTREQHIRREKATSNICTNQALLALRAAVYLAAMGPDGLRTWPTCACKRPATPPPRLTAGTSFTPGVRPADVQGIRRPRARRPGRGVSANPRLRHDIFAGVPLGRWYPELADCLLVAVTEKRTRAEIDRLAALACEMEMNRRAPLTRRYCSKGRSAAKRRQSIDKRPFI